MQRVQLPAQKPYQVEEDEVLPIALEGDQHGQGLLGAQLQLLADLLNDCLAAGVGCRSARTPS